MGAPLPFIIVVIVVVVAFFGWAALRGYLRGKVGGYHQNYQESEKAALAKTNAGEIDHPSWSEDNDKMQMFTNAIRKLMDGEDISDEARRWNSKPGGEAPARSPESVCSAS